MIGHGEVCCATCPFFKAIHNPQELGSNKGECRRYPPQVAIFPVRSNVGGTAMQIHSAWGVVEGELVCGEHPLFTVLKVEVNNPRAQTSP